MALAKLGQSIAEIKGKIGGTIFQNYHGKTMLRVRHTHKQAAKTSGGTQKPNFAIVQSSWRELTVGERAAWIAAAAIFPFVDKFGDQYFGSGYQLFMRCNLIRLTHGVPVSAVVPVVNNSNRGPSGEEVDIIGMQQPRIDISWVTGAWPITNLFLVASSPPVSSSITKPPARFVQLVSAPILDGLISSVDSRFTGKYGFPLVDDQVIWFRFQTVDPVNGFISAPRYQRIVYADNQ